MEESKAMAREGVGCLLLGIAVALAISVGVRWLYYGHVEGPDDSEMFVSLAFGLPPFIAGIVVGGGLLVLAAGFLVAGIIHTKRMR